MSKSKALVIAVVALLALAAVPFVYAQTAHNRHGGLMFGRLKNIKAALGLTDDQVAQLKVVRQDLRAQNAPYREQLVGGYGQVAQLLLKDPNNIAGAQALIDQQAAARKAVQVNVLNAVSKALNILTPEQRATAAQLLQQRLATYRQQLSESH